MSQQDLVVDCENASEFVSTILDAPGAPKPSKRQCQKILGTCNSGKDCSCRMYNHFLHSLQFASKVASDAFHRRNPRVVASPCYILNNFLMFA